MPPKAFAAGCGAGAAGFDAYSDKIDCFRSDLPLPVPGVFGPVLDGRAGGADCVPPKKSSPSKLSPGRVCLGCAAGALGGAGLLNDGSVVLGLAGCGIADPESSPNKSNCCCGRARGGPAIPPGALPFLKLAPRSRCLTFSCTTFSGTSSSASPSSSVLGSGMGPSMTHRLLSYLVRMKFSILASFGTCPSASLCSQYLLARVLPQRIMLWSCSSVHVSRSTLLTLDMCTPSERWMPEQRMQTKTPRFQLAHRGCLLRLQSLQLLLPSNLTNCLSVARFCSLRSGPAGGRRDMIVTG